MTSEVGRELKVSELTRGGVVILAKPGRPLASVRVVGIGSDWVTFRAQYPDGREIHFVAKRTGADKEQVSDDDHPMKMYEYLGE